MTETLNSVCEFIVDCLHATAPVVEDGYPLIRTPNIGKGRLDLNRVYRVTDEVYEKWTQRAIPQDNDLIFAREATAGNIAIIKGGERVCLGQRTVLLRPNPDKIDPDFLCYYLLAPEQQSRLLSGATGATAAHVNMKDIRKLTLINMPHIQIQREIGEILSAYDDLIENNTRRIQLLEESVRHLYEEWFVRLRFPGYEHTTIEDGVPEGWNLKTLSAISQIIMGQSPPSELYNYDGIGLPFHQGVTNYGNRFVSHHVFTTSENRVAEPGDILCSVRAPVGRLNITLDKIIIGRGLASIRSLSGNQIFLYYLLKALFYEDDIIGNSGAIFSAIKKEELKNQRILLPHERYILAFEDIVKPVDLQIINLHQTNEKLRSARDLLLPRLISGEIPV